MSNLFDAVTTGDALTANGCATNSTTSNLCLDLFFMIGASRGKNIIPEFQRAFYENGDLATRILLHARDCRGGAGERQTFRNILKWLVTYDVELAQRVVAKVPELGRWDDVLVLLGTPAEKFVLGMISDALAIGNGNCAKWMPRPTRNQAKLAKPIWKHLEMAPAEYRKLVSGLTVAVEKQLCAKQFDQINYDHLPAMAAARYQKAFGKHDAKRYNEYIQALENGEAKINAGVIYPHDVIISMRNGNARVANEQWKALPNYMEGTNERILPVIDVSGSMNCAVGGNPSLTCMDVAIALGMYVAERNESAFKNEFITFDTTPKMVKIVGNTLQERYAFTKHADWGRSTNFVRTFDLILAKAKMAKLSPDDMPTKVIVFSDMEFNEADRSGSTAFQNIQEKFEAAGYAMPQMVFWNLNARPGNNPVKADTSGTALVSGLSPSILTALFGGDLDPVSVMLNAVQKDRYNY